MPLAPPRILIIEDEPSILDNVVYALDREGMLSERASTGALGLDLIEAIKFDLVVLDIGLPDISGIEVCKKIRSKSDIPIIFLTARADEIDRILGLELGADDYITKPFSPRELAVRVKTILRRISNRTGHQERAPVFNVDQDRKEIKFMGTLLALTPFEYGILGKLISQPRRVFSRESLLYEVWTDSEDTSDRVIDTHIKSIRSKLRTVDPTRHPIRTHRSFGYSLEEP